MNETIRGRKFPWNSGTFPHIEGVYEKAGRNEGLAHFLADAENAALLELRKSAPLIYTSTGPILPEMTDKMGIDDKERIMGYLAKSGIEELYADFQNQKIVIRFSPLMMDVLVSSFFSLLDALEVLDQAGQSPETKVVLEMKIPVGAAKVLPAWHTFISQLYPWIGDIRETSTGEMAVHVKLAENPVKA